MIYTMYYIIIFIMLYCRGTRRIRKSCDRPRTVRFGFYIFLERLRVRLNRPGKVLRKLLCGTVKYYVMLLRRIPARYGYLPQEDNRAQR